MENEKINISEIQNNIHEKKSEKRPMADILAEGIAKLLNNIMYKINSVIINIRDFFLALLGRIEYRAVV